jgi:hypothetical protein
VGWRVWWVVRLEVVVRWYEGPEATRVVWRGLDSGRPTWSGEVMRVREVRGLVEAMVVVVENVAILG